MSNKIIFITVGDILNLIKLAYYKLRLLSIGISVIIQ